MERRNALKLLGGLTVIAAGGAGAFAMTRTPEQALVPWGSAGSTQYTDPRMHALSYAILAPNPHNRQPWLIELDQSDSLTLRFDETKQLPHTDPFDRQLTIGLGCFLELLKMAANENGFQLNIELFPEGSNAEDLGSLPIAHVKFTEVESQEKDPLWAYVAQRRTNKKPFDVAKPVSEEDLNKVLAVGQNGTTLNGVVESGEVQRWRELTSAALQIETKTPHTFKESVDLFRIGRKEIEANPDGIAFSGALFESMAMMGMFSRESTLDPESSSYKQGLQAVLANTQSAMGFIWMVTPGNTREQQIAAGADWLRVNLATTSLGLGFHPLSQLLQEYPEMEELYNQTHEQLAPDGGTVQMLARIGYGAQIAPSPRWAIESKVQLL